MRRVALAAIPIAVAALVAGCSAGTAGGSISSSGGGNGTDPAALLAQRDGSSDVASYSAALDAWQAECTQDRVADAGMVDFAFTDEQKNGVAESSRLVVMQHLTASVPAGSAPTDCNAITAAYLVTVEK